MLDSALPFATALASATEVRVAPKGNKWNVLAGTTASEVAFAVPMIGAWIARNRALEILRGLGILSNPRAQRYWELATESLTADRYDEAIADFRQALSASPEYMDALRGLSRALTLRHKPGDLREAAEFYERLLALDAGEPRAGLAEILADLIDEGGAVAAVPAAFRRIKELDAGGSLEKRAVRRLSEASLTHEAPVI